MATVYAHFVTDHNTSQKVVAPHKRTKPAIDFLKAEIIPETAVIVPDDHLDGEGRYNPENH